MAENGSKSQMNEAKNEKRRQETEGIDIEVENTKDISKILHRKLSDVGAYSYSALCAVSFLQLFEDQWHTDFKTASMKLIVEHLHLPDQARDSVMAIMEGQGFDDARPYVDMVLSEPVLERSGVPVVSDLLALSISDGCYDSRMRVLIKHVAWQLRVSWDTLEQIEASMAETLEFANQEHYKMSEEEKKEKQKQSRIAKAKRFALIGLATTVGGTLIGLTGGLAAPLVAAGAGAIIGGAGAAVLGSTAGVAIIGSLFGVAGAGLTGYKMKKRVGPVEEFEFEPLVFGSCLKLDAHPAKQLHITVAVSGWLTTSMTDFRYPWYSLAESQEQYSLRWESKYLIQLGCALDYILGGAMSAATQEVLKYTVLSGILAAVTWPAVLVSMASVIDNPWSVCIQRATAVGKEMAEVLLAREQGQRPVTLIGFSLGARVVFSCLEELARRKGSEGIVEDAILLGAPVSGDPKVWSSLTRVVGGKIINGYCRGDWLLKFLFRTASVHLSTVAGLGPIKWENRRMHNIDLSDVVNGHKDYLKQLDVILKVVGVRTKSDVKLPSKPSVEFLRDSSCDSFTSSDGEIDTSSDVVRQTNLPADDGRSPDHMDSNDQSDASFVVVLANKEAVTSGNDQSDQLNVSVSDETEDSIVTLPNNSADVLISQYGNPSVVTSHQLEPSFVPISEGSLCADVNVNSDPTVNYNPSLPEIQSNFQFLKLGEEKVTEDRSRTTSQASVLADSEPSDLSFVRISEDGDDDQGSVPVDLSDTTFKQYLGTVIDCDLDDDQ